MLTRLIALGAALLALASTTPARAADSDLVVIITNSKYQFTHNVDFAHEDGKAFKQAAIDVFGVPDTRIIVRTDLALGGFNQLFGVDSIKSSLIAKRLDNNNPKARLYVFYSGHGMPSQQDAKGNRSAFLMPVDAEPTSIDSMGFELERLLKRLREIKADLLPEGQVVLVLDACFSGISPKGSHVDKSSAGGPIRFAPRATTATSSDIVVLSASADSEIAFWDERAKLGVFTHAIIQGLYGSADRAERIGNGDFKLTVGELRQFTTDFVRRRLDSLYDKQARSQNPVFTGSESLVIASYANKTYPSGAHDVQRQVEHSRCEALKRSVVPSQIDEFLTKDCILCECRDALLRRKADIVASRQICSRQQVEIERLLGEGELEQLEIFVASASCPQLKIDFGSRLDQLKQACANDNRRLEELKRKSDFLDELKTAVSRRRYECATVHRAAAATLARIESACQRARKGYEEIRSKGDPDTLSRFARSFRTDCPAMAVRAEREAEDLRTACSNEEKRLIHLEVKRDFAAIREIASKGRCEEIREKAGRLLKDLSARCATESVEWEKRKASTDAGEVRRFLEGLVCSDLRPEVEKRLIALEDQNRPPIGKGQPVRECPTCPEVVMLRPGCFVMGGNPSDPSTVSAERPQVKMRIPRPFAIGTREVTIGEWNQCHTQRAEKGCQLPAPSGVNVNLPMTGVSWNDAGEFVRWLTKRTKAYYRLPSEAEWEYAARAGTISSYAFGDVITAKQARFRGSSGPAPVGNYPANPFGLFDMHGNVSELVADCFVDTHAGRPLDGRAVTQCATSRRVVRGGSWRRLDSSLRSAWRDYIDPDRRADDVGFRVARSILQSENSSAAPATCP